MTHKMCPRLSRSPMNARTPNEGRWTPHGAPKERRGRTIPIHPSLRKILAVMPHHADGMLLHGPRGGRLKPDTVRNIFIREVIVPLKQEFPALLGESASLMRGCTVCGTTL